MLIEGCRQLTDARESNRGLGVSPSLRELLSQHPGQPISSTALSLGAYTPFRCEPQPEMFSRDLDPIPQQSHSAAEGALPPGRAPVRRSCSSGLDLQSGRRCRSRERSSMTNLRAISRPPSMCSAAMIASIALASSIFL